MTKGNDEQQLSKWTQQLHDKLAGHEAPVPADLWADIEAALSEGSGQRFQALQSADGSGQRFQALQQRKARLVPLRRWAAAAAIALVLAGGGLIWWGVDSHQAEPLISMAEESAAAPSNVEGDGAAEGRGGGSNSSTFSIVQTNKAANTAKLQTPPPPLNGGGAAAHDKTDEDLAQSTETPVSQSQSAETPVSQSQSSETPVIPPRHEEKMTVLPSTGGTVPRPHRPKHQPSLGLYAMNGFGSGDNSNAVMMADALARNYSSTYAAGQAASRQAPIFLTGFEERQHHRQPVSFGLSVSYPLSRRFSLTTGLVYTRLRSDFTQIIRSQQYTKEQTLHYVGVPLGLNYRLWQHRGFRAYLSAGMQADWNVKAQLNAEGVEQEMSRDRLQWSANGSLGLQYDVLPQFSLYAEPGINHYLDNGSAVQNFFKDKPTSLKLQFGIRLNLQKLQ